MDTRVQEKLDSAMNGWKEFWGDSLSAAYLFGSAARSEWNAKTSDINLLLLVTEKGYDRWLEAGDIARRRAKKGFALPLILTENYIRSSVDVFPMEFLDIKLFHKTLLGQDLFDSITISSSDLRMQAEREVKGKWVQLRQAALDRGGNTVAMRDLLVMSVPTWVSVFQAILKIKGAEVPQGKRETLSRGATTAGLNPDVFLELERVRRERSALNRSSAWDLLRRTLEQVDQLARFVDGWQVE